MYSLSLPPSIIPLPPANPPSFLQVSTHIYVFPLFCDPLSLTMALFVAMGLELSTETLWAHQWVLPEDNDSPSLRIPQKIVQQGGVGSVLSPFSLLIDSWKVWSCKNSVQATVAAVRFD